MTDKLNLLLDTAKLIYAGIDKTKFIPVNKESTFTLSTKNAKGYKNFVALYLQDVEKKLNITIHVEEEK